MKRKNKGKLKRSSNGNARQRANLSLRMNILFFTIFILFSGLVIRLGYMQIVKGDEYAKQLEKTEEATVNTSVPRGRIFDRNGKILVDNKPKNAITYTKYSTTTSDEMLKMAKKLGALIKMDTSRIAERDKLDYWMIKYPKQAKAKITDEEELKILGNGLKAGEQQNEIDGIVRSRITPKELKLLTKKDLQIVAIYSKMVAGYNLSPQIIKSDKVSDKEFAVVSEHLTDLPGVNTTTDWQRELKSKLTILGRTTSPQEGIPKDKLSYFLARDYSRNDRVGKSYIEQQYESILQGEKSVVKSDSNSQGEIVDTKVVKEGTAGKDLVLTIDSKLQKATDKIVTDQLLMAKRTGSSSLLDRAFLVMMDPKTGEVLSMVGKKIEKDDNGKQVVNDYSIGAFTSSYEVGSVVKPATLLTGYHYGAITPGESQVDSPVKLAGTKPKSSIFNRGGSILMDDLTALERSSNVYMFKTLMKVAKMPYIYNGPLPTTEVEFNRVRRYYAQFGLGVETGIDLPGEFTGVKGPETAGGKYLDLAIGQYDTYTPMQLAQYVSTIANGGKRIAPRLLKEIHEPSTDGETIGALDQEIQPKVLGTIENTTAEIDHVKKGMTRVYYGANGSGAGQFRDSKFKGAGKTGTAQVVYFGPQKERYGTQSLTVTHVGFAPEKDPQIAYAVIVPWITTSEQYTAINNIIARQSVDKFFELKKKENKKINNEVGNKIER
ncbi:peptidoglycan D,D-transpeptidase FtsI family protein [Kurthia sibirica]|uniref:Penicillin-binding protein n=1 Tax=Kurthia sibirica TaxID=202750 RepID=A0A2U3AM11_9BACL|nr:penicillin-binding protein 2 [Kurthia sibirica]PWI25554.1 penicillin-binding protein [Kurthia sibirica]GEK33933.1 penicillin-binding protein [Kurthia sibirica]